MKEFVKVARRRMKYISVCGGAAVGGGMPQDIAAEVLNIITDFFKCLLHVFKNITAENFICFFNILQVLPVKVVTKTIVA